MSRTFYHIQRHFRVILLIKYLLEYYRNYYFFFLLGAGGWKLGAGCYTYGNNIDERVDVKKAGSPLESYIPLHNNIGNVIGLTVTILQN